MVTVGLNEVQWTCHYYIQQNTKKMDDSTESTDWEDTSMASGLRNDTNREGSIVNTGKEMRVHKDDLAQVLDFAQDSFAF